MNTKFRSPLPPAATLFRMENKWPGWHPEKVMRQKSVRKPPFQILRKTKKPSFSLPFFAARAAGLIPACPPLGSNEARWPVLRQM